MSAFIPILKSVSVTTDCDLVSLAITGLEDGFEELVRRYQRPIAAYVYRMVGDYELALDLTQEVFIKIYRSLATYRSEYKFSTWIYTIAHNTAIDYLRRQSWVSHGLVSKVRGQEHYLHIAGNGLSPEQESEQVERRAEIAMVVRRLPAAYRQLIVLRYLLELDHHEIVELSGLPLGTVKNRLFRARGILRHHLVRRGITGV